MDRQKFEEKLGPTVRKIIQTNKYKSVGSFRPLPELLVEWYERKLKEDELNQTHQAKQHYQESFGERR